MVVLGVLAALVAAGVDVDGDERLGLVDDDVAAALEVDLAGEGGFELAGDVEAVEDGLGFVVELGPWPRSAGRFDRSSPGCARMLGMVVDDDALDVLGEEIADGALDEVGLAEDAARARAGW